MGAKEGHGEEVEIHQHWALLKLRCIPEGFTRDLQVTSDICLDINSHFSGEGGEAAWK